MISHLKISTARFLLFSGCSSSYSNIIISIWIEVKISRLLITRKMTSRRLNQSCPSMYRYWLDLSPEDIYWNIADTGWAKAAYGFFGPWFQGSCIFVHHKPLFEPLNGLETLQKYPISTFCAPPTVYRMMIQEDLTSFKFPHLRHCVGGAEPLNPEVVEKWREATGLQIWEGYGQSETVSRLGAGSEFSYI